MDALLRGGSVFNFDAESAFPVIGVQKKTTDSGVGGHRTDEE
jgi:hypothetical protein